MTDEESKMKMEIWVNDNRDFISENEERKRYEQENPGMIEKRRKRSQKQQKTKRLKRVGGTESGKKKKKKKFLFFFYIFFFNI